MSKLTFMIYRNPGKKPGEDFYWKLVHEDGVVLAKSEIGYPREDIKGAIKVIREEIKHSLVDWENRDENPHKAEEENSGGDDARYGGS